MGSNCNNYKNPLENTPQCKNFIIYDHKQYSDHPSKRLSAVTFTNGLFCQRMAWERRIATIYQGQLSVTANELALTTQWWRRWGTLENIFKIIQNIKSKGILRHQLLTTTEGLNMRYKATSRAIRYEDYKLLRMLSGSNWICTSLCILKVECDNRQTIREQFWQITICHSSERS